MIAISHRRVSNLNQLFDSVRMIHLTIRLFLLSCWLVPVFFAEAGVITRSEESGANQLWASLCADAERMQLPTTFLKALPPDFIHF